MENCDKDEKVDYKERLLKAVTRLQEIKEKHRRDILGLKKKLSQVDLHVQHQFDKLRTRLTIFNNERKTACESTVCSKTSTMMDSTKKSDAKTNVVDSFSSVQSGFSVSRALERETDKFVEKITTHLKQLDWEERMALTNKLTIELKKMRVEDKKALYVAETNNINSVEANTVVSQTTVVGLPNSVSSQLNTAANHSNDSDSPECKNGEIGASNERIELTAKDSLITAQILMDMVEPIQPSLSPTTANQGSSVTTAFSSSNTSPKKNAAEALKTSSNSAETLL